jgi:hypothetical protein
MIDFAWLVGFVWLRAPAHRLPPAVLRQVAAPPRQAPRPLNAKRAYLINGSDPQLAATASGILLADGMISRAQHDAQLHYARWRRAFSTCFGNP